jgi:hypothetical protein
MSNFKSEIFTLHLIQFSSSVLEMNSQTSDSCLGSFNENPPVRYILIKQVKQPKIIFIKLPHLNKYQFLFLTCFYWSRDSSVGTALGYGLDDRDSRVRFPTGAGNFSLHHRVQNGSGAHPAIYSMGTRGSYPGGKAAGAWIWQLTSI